MSIQSLLLTCLPHFVPLSQLTVCFVMLNQTSGLPMSKKRYLPSSETSSIIKRAEVADVDQAP